MDLDFPNDENGQVLRRMQRSGDDLARPRNIEFHFLFQARSQAIAFVERVTDESLTLAIRRYEKRNMWECTATKHMLRTDAGVTALENYLCEMAQPLEGVPDGWGCFQVD